MKGLDIHMYRVKEDLYCNIAGVRNLGAKECKTPYMMIIDMDTVVTPVMSTELVKLAKSRNESYPTCFFFHANSKHDIANEIKSRNNEEVPK